MSWWDTKQLANFATQALKTAQKRIDKVLDIKDEETSEAISSLPTELSSDDLTASPKQNDTFFDSWLGENVWSNTTSSANAVQSDAASSKSSLRSTNTEQKTKPLFKSRDELHESKNKPSAMAAALTIVGNDAGSASANEEENLPEKTDRKPNSGFVTSFMSAFDQVQQVRLIVQDDELPKEKSRTQTVSGETDHGISNASSGRTEDQLDNEVSAKNSELIPKFSSETIIHDYSLTDKEAFLSSELETCHENSFSEGLETMLSSNTEEVKACNLVKRDESASGEMMMESTSALLTEDDAGWADVNLNVLSQEEAIELNESIPTRDMQTSTFTEEVKISDAAVDVLEPYDAVVADEEVNSFVTMALPGHVVSASMELDEKEATESNEVELSDSKQTVFSSKDCSTVEEDIASSVASSVSEIYATEKKDVLRGISSSVLSSASEVDVSLREGISLEGSLAASDELSESNKTLTADDLEGTRDDTDVEETKQEFSQGEELEKSQFMGIESSASSVTEFVTFEMEKAEPDVDEIAHILDTTNDDKLESPEAAQSVTENLTELTVNTDNAEKIETAKNDDSPRSVMSGSSYVRNLLEEAMVESNRDSNTDNSHGSEVIRESEYTSGHTSADEIDTTTSSDIEIISHISTPNSNFRPLVIDTKPFDVSPSKAHAWSRSMRSVSPHGHKRSDSGSSAQSLQSRNGEDLVSPESLLHRVGEDHSPMEDRNWRGHGQRLHSHRYPGIDACRRQTQECSDQDPSNNPYETEKLLKKLAEMAIVLEAREKKQLELSQENVDLLEANAILRNQLKQLEEAREAEMEDVKEVTDEFTRRIAESEKKLQMVVREKEALRKTLQDLEIGKRSENVMNEKLVKEKEQVIAELLEEGEKLSKQQLQSNNIIKKLRSKEKDNETSIRTQKQRLEEQREEIERLEGILEIKVDLEKKHVDTINQLNMAMKTQEEEINRLKSELEDAVEKARSLKVALDNSYKEISELHRARVTDVTEAQKVAINTEMQVKEQLKQKLEEHQQQSKQQLAALVTQIEDLQLSLCRMEKEHGRREDILRQEISDLQQHLQDAEERNQELTQSVSAATRPLLRQIENLQTTYSAQSSSYERVEKNLTDRLSEAQSQLAVAVEKERVASDRLIESSARLTSLESQISTLKQERVQLQSQLDMERSKVELMQESKNNEAMQRDTALHRLQLEVNDLKKDKVLLENQLEVEKMKVEAEWKKVALVHEQLREKEMTIMQLSSSSNSLTKHDAMIESLSTSSSTATIRSSTPCQDDVDKMFLSAGTSSRVSLYESLRSLSSSSLLENLQSQLKQREGEIVQLQSDISELERTRESMARQLVTLTLANEDMEQKLDELTNIQKQHAELNGRYNALLQMYGEKVEEGDELRMDLQDIKEMYKSQIDELLKSKSLPSSWNY